MMSLMWGVWRGIGELRKDGGGSILVLGWKSPCDQPDGAEEVAVNSPTGTHFGD